MVTNPLIATALIISLCFVLIINVTDGTWAFMAFCGHASDQVLYSIQFGHW